MVGFNTMKKTIFYIPSKTEEGDYWFDNTPYKKLLEMEDYLYEPNSSITKSIVVENNIINNLTVTNVVDIFSTEGIVRRIAFYVSK